MTLHAVHNVQQTSVNAYYTEKPKLTGRYKEIMKCYRMHGDMTARECKNRLSLEDMNQVRPRITELCKKPYEMLEIVGEKLDPVTKKTVSVFGVKNNEPVQMSLV